MEHPQQAAGLQQQQMQQQQHQQQQFQQHRQHQPLQQESHHHQQHQQQQQQQQQHQHQKQKQEVQQHLQQQQKQEVQQHLQQQQEATQHIQQHQHQLEAQHHEQQHQAEALQAQQQQMMMYAAAMQQNPAMMMMPYMVSAGSQLPANYARVPLPTEVMEEQPTYVNAKQYSRIIKRRQARAKLEARKKVPQQRKSYLHKSRHDHACRRVRGPGGRFLTKAELKAFRLQLEAQDPEGATSSDPLPNNAQV
ncbi:unnamed protein product [Choristocarpus tenellus]